MKKHDMSVLNCSNTPLAGLKLIRRQRIGDHRGFLERIFCAEELQPTGWQKAVAQINHTYTQKRGTVRGLHFQYPPYAEMKMVICLSGAVWDVAVDLRSDSPTFLSWHAEELSAENQHSLLIPEGFAHGFQTLSDDVEMLYCHSESYAPKSEGGLHPQDPRLAIPWPQPISILSERDIAHPMIANDFKGIVL